MTVIRILVDIKKGPLGVSAAAIPLRFPRLGNSASHTSNIGQRRRFDCSIDHTSRCNATFCDAQHTAPSGVSVFSEEANRQPLAEGAMIGFELVGLSFLTLCFMALQFACLVASHSH